jgi:hypothetical protein
MLHLLPRLPRLEERTSPGHHGAAAAPARPPRYGVDPGAQAAPSGDHAPSHHGAAAAPARPPPYGVDPGAQAAPSGHHAPSHHGAAAAPACPPRYGVDSGAQAATAGHHAPSHHGAAAAPARPPLDTLMVGEFISVQRCNMLRLLPEAREKAAWLTDDLIDAGNYCVMVCSF